VVHPGGVNTDIARNARPPRHVTNEEASLLAAERDRFQKFLRMSPVQAGELIVAAIERNAPGCWSAATRASDLSSRGCCRPAIGTS
jgi:hypothetical protein